MRRIWCVLLFLIGALLLAAKLSEASGALRVDEAATRLLFHSDRAETSNRTEQRRFDLRLSREPIHVYVIDDGNKVPGEPVNSSD